MLFLLNDIIVDIESPEALLNRTWRELGCTDPHAMRASDALEFVRNYVQDYRKGGPEIDEQVTRKLGALVIAKTGANAAIIPGDKVKGPVRLTCLPDATLRQLQLKRDIGKSINVNRVWQQAA